ncbi:MAG: glycosyltransferase [Dokdonella sp.]|uniref:glycosyltransferase n=1 Tax=Dokdonella sp. TaxID=2291710 RepID=UPI003F818FFA
MRILIVATKSPHPACDGGRLALWHMLCGLAGAGHELAVVAPAGEPDHNRKAAHDGSLPYRARAVRMSPRGVFGAAALALASGGSLGVARHASHAMRNAVADEIARWRPHVVHAEQLHAFANCEAAMDAGVPLVLRMQNVESALRAQQARLRPGARLALGIEAARLHADEGAALARAVRTIALTEEDADALRAAHPAATVVAVAPAFAPSLQPAPPLAGEPAIALAGSGGWWPNADGERWMLRQAWPQVAARLPGAVLHRFGGATGDCARTCRHPAPADSRDAFPERAIAAVPLRAASGIRMRILEAWARGLPGVATPAAARGLAVTDGHELLVAGSAVDFAEAIARVHHDRVLRDALVGGGREYLRRHHAGARQTRALLAVYEEACGR